jgi:hypothetical protein
MKLSRVEIPKVVGKIINHFNTIIFSICSKEFFYEFDSFYDIISKVSRKENYAQIRIAEGFGPFLTCKLPSHISRRCPGSGGLNILFGKYQTRHVML